MIYDIDSKLLLENLKSRSSLYRPEVCYAFAMYLRECFAGYLPDGHCVIDGKLYGSRTANYVAFHDLEAYRQRLKNTETKKFLVDICYDTQAEHFSGQDHLSIESFFVVTYVEVPLD